MGKLPLVLAAAGGFLAAVVAGLVVALLGAARHTGRELADLRDQVTRLEAAAAATPGFGGVAQGRPNVLTIFNPDGNLPVSDSTSYVDPRASVIGDVRLGREVYVAPFASIRADEGQPIALGDQTNVQDGVVLHALETLQHGEPVPSRTYEVSGRPYAVFIGRRVSLAHQSQVHGPARIDDGVFVGMQALVFKSWVGQGAVLEPGARVIGVNIPARHYVPAGMVVTDQAVADKLPAISDSYPFAGLNDAVVHVNTGFARGYGAAANPAPDAVPAIIGDVAATRAGEPEH